MGIIMTSGDTLNLPYTKIKNTTKNETKFNVSVPNRITKLQYKPKTVKNKPVSLKLGMTKQSYRTDIKIKYQLNHSPLW